MSLFVMIPTSFPSLVTGTPEILYWAIRSKASLTVWSSDKNIGSVITPFSCLFTLSTSLAWASIVMFLWIIPIPPSLAIAIAILDSVTVSILALINGIFNWIFLVNWVFKETSLGRTSDLFGTSNTSSNVYAVFNILAILSPPHTIFKLFTYN